MKPLGGRGQFVQSCSLSFVPEVEGDGPYVDFHNSMRNVAIPISWSREPLLKLNVEVVPDELIGYYLKDMLQRISALLPVPRNLFKAILDDKIQVLILFSIHERLKARCLEQFIHHV